MDDLNIQVSLGSDVGSRVFRSTEEIQGWLVSEREFWQPLLAFSTHNHQRRAAIFQPLTHCLDQCGQILTGFSAAKENATRLKQPFDDEAYFSRITGCFDDTFKTRKFPASNSPRAKFLMNLQRASPQGGETALSALGFFLQHEQLPNSQTSYAFFRGILAASYYEQGFTERVVHEAASLDELRTRWEATFENFRSELLSATRTHAKLNVDGEEFLKLSKQRFDDAYAKEESEWRSLHRAYDDSLSLAKPVQYWANKAKSHRCLAWCYAVASVVVAGAVMGALWALIQITLRPPEGINDTSSWHPEYWRVAVLIGAAVFGVWIVRIFVQLLLSNIHLHTDANERVTMARTYLALLRNRTGLSEGDRQLILQTLFRPAVTGVVKDDGVPLAALDWLTKSTGKGN